MRTLLSALTGLLLLAGTAAADEVADATSVHQLIDRQIEAFRADDGAAAYSLAAPRLQEIFPNADLFMAMVKAGYAPVYRPKSVTFGRLKDIPGGYAQEVFLVGPDGETYTALYALEKQPDGSLRIAGCQLLKATGQEA